MVELWKYINDNPGLKISRDAVGWLPAFLGRWCRDCITDIELNEDYFRWLLENQPCLLLIDGLDEIPYRVNREKVARLIENVALYFSKRCQVIVTSRQAAYDEGEVSLVGFTRALINPLRNSDIDQFLGHWSAAMNPLSVDLAKSYQRRPTDSGFATVGSRADQ
jgi:hypothetical protein